MNSEDKPSSPYHMPPIKGAVAAGTERDESAGGGLPMISKASPTEAKYSALNEEGINDNSVK